MSRRWTQEEDDKLIQLWMAEVPVKDIATALNRTQKAIEARVYLYHTELPRRRIDWTPKEISKLLWGFRPSTRSARAIRVMKSKIKTSAKNLSIKWGE